MYKPQHLDLWKLPDSYMGAHWDDYYVFLGKHRDSDLLTQSNYICGLDAIGGETETVLTISENHWAVGWVEWIAIHKSDTKALQSADEIMASLADYPVVDDSHYSELEWNTATEFWAGSSIRDRVQWIREYTHDSIFAARRDYLPQDDQGALLNMLTE